MTTEDQYQERQASCVPLPMGELVHFDVVLPVYYSKSSSVKLDMAHPGNKNGKAIIGLNLIHDVDDLEEIIGKGKSRIQCTCAV